MILNNYLDNYTFYSIDELLELEDTLNRVDDELYEVLRNFNTTNCSGGYLCDIFNNEEIIKLKEVLE